MIPKVLFYRCTMLVYLLDSFSWGLKVSDSRSRKSVNKNM